MNIDKLEDLINNRDNHEDFYEQIRTFTNRDFKSLKKKLKYFDILPYDINELHKICMMKPDKISRYAVFTCNIELLKYVVRNKLKWYALTTLYFSCNNELIMYVIENGCPIFNGTLIHAINFSDDIELVKYFFENNIKIPKKILAYTAKYNRIKCHNYLIENGYKHTKYDLNIMTDGITYLTKRSIQIALEHGCKFNDEDIRNVFYSKNIKLFGNIILLSPEILNVNNIKIIDYFANNLT